MHLLLAWPSGTDLAAQQARASFADDYPLTPVDLSWYGGVHPYGYSLLAPWVMALLGVRLSGLLAAVAGAVLFARLLRQTRRPMAGALTGAVFAVADVVSGRTTFALGAVFALAALVLIEPYQRDRDHRGWGRYLAAIGCAALSGLFSPVAAAFLGLAAAVLVLRRQFGGWSLGLAASVPVGLLAYLFPSGGVQPYENDSAPYAVLAGLVLAALTESPSLRLGGLLYAGAAAVLLLVSDPFGSNILRLGLLVAGPLVVATAAVRRRVLVPVVAVLLLWQAQPSLADLRAGPPPQFATLVAELIERDAKRVEVVPLRDHGEAAYVAPAVPLARGWSRQEDTVRNPLFYDGNLSAEQFERWLRREGVGYVALAPDHEVDFGGRAERALLLVGSVDSLRLVWQDDDWMLWRVEDARPIAEEPVDVLDTSSTELRLHAPEPTEVRLKVRWSRWLSVDGPACVEPDGEWTRLVVHEPGVVVIGSDLDLTPDGHCAD